MASLTWSSVAIGDNWSFARDSAMRIIASSWRTVRGMVERVPAEISAVWRVRRRETKCEERASAAGGVREGAQRLNEVC